AVATLFSISGEQADVFRFRVAENAIGVGIVCLVGLLLLRTGLDDWWLSARGMARSLADALRTPHPRLSREELLVHTLQLRTETIEIAAVPESTPAFNVAWGFVAGAENLIRVVFDSAAEAIRQPDAIAERLQQVANACGGGRQNVVATPERAPSTLVE